MFHGDCSGTTSNLLIRWRDSFNAFTWKFHPSFLWPSAIARVGEPLSIIWIIFNSVRNRVLYQSMWFLKPNSLFVIKLWILWTLCTHDALHSFASLFRLCCSLVFSKTNDSSSYTHSLAYTHSHNSTLYSKILVVFPKFGFFAATIASGSQ